MTERTSNHNVVFSGNQKKHSLTVFQRHELPSDPTLYVVAASKTDPTVAPEGLYSVGGSVNPGGGMPMVFQCGQNVARKIVARERDGGT